MFIVGGFFMYNSVKKLFALSLLLLLSSFFSTLYPMRGAIRQFGLDLRLALSCKLGGEEHVLGLLEEGAGVNFHYFGLPVWRHAVIAGMSGDTVKRMIEQGCDINHRSKGLWRETR